MSEASSLLRLQEVDLQLLRYSQQLKAMPQQKKLAAIEQAKRQIQSTLTQVKGQRKDCEMEIADLEEKKRGYAEKIEMARRMANEPGCTHRQIDYIESQITDLAKATEKADFRHERALEQLDKVEHAEANAAALLERLDGEAQAQQASFQQATSDIMAQARILADERKALVAGIPEDTFAWYERSRKRFGGLAVERLQATEVKARGKSPAGIDYVPSTCRVKLQPSSVGDVRRAGSPIVECPYCHRILVVEGAFSDAE